MATYSRRWTTEFLSFLGVHVVLSLFVYAYSLRDRPKWLETAAGTLTFPTIAYSGLQAADEASNVLLVFQWWERSPLETHFLVWVINCFLWSGVLAWLLCSSEYLTPRLYFGIVFVLAELAFNFVCYSLFVTIEYSAQWRDFISVFGTLATLLAFAIAIKQIADAKLAGEIAAIATKTAADKHKSHYFRHTINESKRIYGAAKTNIAASRWSIAEQLLAVTAEILPEPPDHFERVTLAEVQSIRDGLRDQAEECSRMAAGGRQFKRNEWSEFDTLFSKFVLKIISPYPEEE